MLSRVSSHRPLHGLRALLLCLVSLCAAPSCGGDAVTPQGRARGAAPGMTAGRASPTLLPMPSVTPGPGLLPSSGPGLLPAVSRPPPGDEICASAVVQTNKNMPTVVFVIDGSGSMCAPFGETTTRWQSLRTALLDPMKGLIYRLQNAVSFGVTLYDGTIDPMLSLDANSLVQNPPCALIYGTIGGKNMGMCPQLKEAMPPKLNNAAAIDQVYPMVELGGSTPTDRVAAHVIDALIAGQVPPRPDDPAPTKTYVILATDGAPNDICVNGQGGDGSAQRQGVIAAVDRGAKAGITTWVISLAAGDAVLQAHLDEVAKHGDPGNPAAKTFSPTNPDELIMTLAVLLGGAVGCNVALNGSVTVGQECLGTVEQNGAALPCCQDVGGAVSCGTSSSSSPNGWRLSDPHSIELLGDACAQFLLGSGSVLSARFPCRVFTPD